MAERRMFSKRVVGSARFLKMPISTQCLYFHLGLNADDDGIVEAYTTIKQIGATEDDLKVLVAKGFCKVLNEDLVTYITDWRENNKLRADRKIDSMYKDLLLQMVPDADVQQARRRADLKPLSEDGRPLDVQGTSHGPHRLGKDPPSPTGTRCRARWHRRSRRRKRTCCTPTGSSSAYCC